MFIENVFFDSHHAMNLFFMYIGPETFMPLLSALAAVTGVLMMFWRNVVAVLRKLFRIGPKSQEIIETDKSA